MKLRDKIKIFLAITVGIPALIGVIMSLTWVRKHTTDFWCWVFGI
jgi:hypothetical protein